MKKFRNIIIFSILFIFLATCSIAILISSKSLGKVNLTFDELIKESDCCVSVSLFGPFADDERARSKKVGNNYYIDMWVAYYFERDRDFFPERITIIQEDEPFLETVDLEFSSSMYLLFLTKGDEENTYYVTGGKNGVIRIRIPFFKAENDNLNSELQEKFKDRDALYNWLESTYKFSSDITTLPPDTTLFPWDIYSVSDSTVYTEPKHPPVSTTAPPNNN